MQVHGLKVTPQKISSDLVLFRAPTSGRTHNYKRTNSKRMYVYGNREFVICNGMICWLRNAYKGHFVVWTQQSPDTIIA